MTQDQSTTEPAVTHSVVVPRNDLEAVTIERLVKAVESRPGQTGIRPKAHPLEVGWGDRPTLDDATVQNLARTVFLVETPDEAIFRRLEDAQRTVVAVDHHIYANTPGTVIDRRSPLSSLEQVMRLLDVDPKTLPADLAQDIPLVAANDRGFIPALATEARRQTPSEAQARARVWDIRCQDLTIARLAAETPPPDIAAVMADAPRWSAALAETEGQIRAAQEALRQALTDEGRARWLDLQGVPSPGDGPRLLLACVPDSFRYVMADAVYWHEAEAKGVDALTRPLEMLLVFYNEAALMAAREKAPAADDPSPDAQEPAVKPTEAAAYLTRIEFSGAGDRLDQVAQWFDPAVRKTWSAAIKRLDCYAGGGDSAYFGARDTLGDHAAALSELVEHLLGDLLTGNRPVTAWRTSFLQALALGDRLETLAEADAESEADATVPVVGALKRKVLDHLSTWHHATPDEDPRPHPLEIGDEEWHYFLPHLRDLMAWRPDPSDGLPPWEQAVREIARGRALVSLALPCQDLTFTLHRKAAAGEPHTGYAAPVTLDVTELRLHFFYNDVLLVEWTVGEQPPDAHAFESIGWPQLLAPGRADLQRPLGQVIEINGKLRFTHSTMCSESGEQGRPSEVTLRTSKTRGATLRHGAGISETPFDGWFPSLLSYALGLTADDLAPGGVLSAQGPAQARALFDDRARVIASVVPVGRSPVTPRGQALFDVMRARLTTVEPYGSDHAYDPAFAVKEYRSGHYDRYLSWGTHYMATPHSFVCMVMDNGFTRAVIHGIHMATLYRRMALIAQAYVATLGAVSLYVNDALRVSTHPPAKPDGTPWSRKEIEARLTTLYHALHRRQLEFTNHIWFERMSSQVQGVELFDLMRQQTRSAEDYRMVQDEIQQMQNFLSAEDDARKTDAITEEERRERAIATIALPFALLFALLGSQGIAGHFFLWPLLDGTMAGLGLSTDYTWVLASVLALVIAGVIGMAVSPKLFETWAWIGPRLRTQRARACWQTGARRVLIGGALLLFGLGLALQSSGHLTLEPPPTAASEQTAGD